MFTVILTAFCLFITDQIWLFYTAPFYISCIGHWLNIQDGVVVSNLYAVVIAYLAFAIAIRYFAVQRANGKKWPAFYWGAMSGLMVNGSFQFMNLAYMNQWSLRLAIFDVSYTAIEAGVFSFLIVAFSNYLGDRRGSKGS